MNVLFCRRKYIPSAYFPWLTTCILTEHSWYQYHDNICILTHAAYLIYIICFLCSKLINKCMLISSSNSYTYYCHNHNWKGLLVHNGITTSYSLATEYGCDVCGSRVYIYKICNSLNHRMGWWWGKTGLKT